MKSLFSLDNRLALCAELVRENKSVADIGTDHAYLPVWLCKSGKTPCAIAADIKQEPLNNGIKTIEKYDATSFVSTRLSDGLLQINPNEADDIVIAGMGGELIVHILNNANWVKSQDKHLVLQPMSKSEVLVAYLYDNEYFIDKQRCCIVDNKVYTVISAYYSGKTAKYTEASCYLGKLCPAKEPLDKLFIENEIKHLLNKAKGDQHFAEIAQELQKSL